MTLHNYPHVSVSQLIPDEHTDPAIVDGIQDV